MEMEPGKLFIGGISWDTNEDRLKQYFEMFGDVKEAVIMKDRITGRARGFGFVVYADPAVADQVVMEKHVVDGRTVEAKKAVPRDDQNNQTKNNGNIHGSPDPNRTKKIFVGGLASTVTENNFKNYFNQFGTITDVVVMYDHNTKRPRGFGFITFESEEAVEKVLYKTFHELNGKMVEVKRAVPKEYSLGVTRGQLGGNSYGLNRVNDFLNGYIRGCNPSLVGGHGLGMDGRISSSLLLERTGYPFPGPNYGVRLNFEPTLSHSTNTNFITDHAIGRQLNSPFNENSNRYSATIGYNSALNGGNNSTTSLNTQNLWGNGGLTNITRSPNYGSLVGYGNDLTTGTFGSIGTPWRSFRNSGQVGVGDSPYSLHTGSYDSGDMNLSLGSLGYGRNDGATGAHMSHTASNYNYGREYTDDFDLGSFHGKSAWLSSPLELENSGLLGNDFGNVTPDLMSKRSTSLIGT